MRFGTTHWRSPKFPDEYVSSLRRQFAEQGHHLTVLGNGKHFDEWLRRTYSIGWQSKIEWFMPHTAHLRPAVVFDLDTFIWGDPSPFLDLDESKLWLIRQFMSNSQLGESGIFVAPDDDALCASICKRAEAWDFSRGDGALLREFAHEFIPDVIDGIYSYKAHMKDQPRPPADTRVICLHGKPTFEQLPDGYWLKESWRSGRRTL